MKVQYEILATNRGRQLRMTDGKTPMLADLHTHSRASDGQYSPADLVRLAKKSGVEVLALTDHDTIDGLEEAVGAGSCYDLQILRGVELSAKEHKDLHLLGYGFSEGDSSLWRLCDQLRSGREQRKHRIIQYLHDCGVDIPLSEVEALSGGRIVARPHFAQVIIRHGYAETVQEVFARWLDTPAFAEVERQKPDAEACIRVIHESGGICSWAHPYQLSIEEAETEALLRKLVASGLDAIECYYPAHSKEQTEFYLHLCKKYQLHCTGGSDFHGEAVKAGVSLARWPLELDWIGRPLCCTD